MLVPVLLFIAVTAAAALAGMLFPQGSAVRRWTAPAVTVIGGIALLAGLLAAFGRIGGGAVLQLGRWQLPFAGITAGLDVLSVFFLFPLVVLAVAGALYGPRYFDRHREGRSHWLFYGLLVSGMIMVLLARNAVLFIIAWEVMSLSSFFLVLTDRKQLSTLRAGWTYFVTAHIGTAFLLALFLLLARAAGSFDFTAWTAAGLSAGQADAVFILALIAFGLKAGFIPFHIWLPLAHPAAPSHVSGLMSGIMIKMGIYGILRILTFIMPFHAWWGYLLLGLGAVSGILGVLFAIGQHDIKRLLAYHSVENIGIILIGTGLGIIGVAAGVPQLAVFGFAGGLLHIVNHSLFKALLFLGAGAVIRQTGSGNLDRLGGLIRSMPKTAFLFLVGAAAICGLPLFNGFISELLIYAGAIGSATGAVRPSVALAGLAGVLSLALIGGLAVVCFTKVFGIVFLGEPRTGEALNRTEVPAPMVAGMGMLALLCIGIGLGSPFVLPYLVAPVRMFTGSAPAPAAAITALLPLLLTVSIILSATILLALIVGAVRIAAGRGRSATRQGTWDCGYAAPDATMQYTASSFADPVVGHFARALAAEDDVHKNDSYFPAKPWSFHSKVDDWFLSRIFSRMLVRFDQMFSWLRWFQNGRAGMYILYIALTVICVIIWKFLL